MIIYNVITSSYDLKLYALLKEYNYYLNQEDYLLQFWNSQKIQKWLSGTTSIISSIRYVIHLVLSLILMVIRLTEIGAKFINFYIDIHKQCL